MFAFSIARRFLAHNKLQTILITLGIAIGVSVQVFIGSLIQGLQQDLINTTIGSSSHVTIQAANRNERMPDDEAFFEMLQGFDDEITVVSRTLQTPGNIQSDQSDPVVIRSFDFEAANKIYDFDENLISGVLPENDNEITLGKDLVDALELSLGDNVEVFVNETFDTTDFTLVGIFDFGSTQINESWLVTTIDTTKAILDTEEISAYEMQISDVFYADILASNLRGSIDEDTYRVSDWKSANQDLLSGLNGQSVSSLMIQIFVIISVVLGIASVLAVSVLQKSKQLGILKAMGIKDKQASLIFLFQGLILGFIGAILGVLIGLGLSYSFTIFAVNPDGTPVVELFISPPFIVLSAFIAIAAALVASIIPAKRSAKLSVIEVIRNG